MTKQVRLGGDASGQWYSVLVESTNVSGDKVVVLDMPSGIPMELRAGQYEERTLGA